MPYSVRRARNCSAQTAVDQETGRDVERQFQTQAVIEPFAPIEKGLGHHPVGQLRHQPGLFRQADETVRRHQAQFGMLNPAQRLDAEDGILGGLKRHLGLVLDPDIEFIQRLLEMRQREGFHGGGPSRTAKRRRRGFFLIHDADRGSGRPESGNSAAARCQPQKWQPRVEAKLTRVPEHRRIVDGAACA